MTTLHTDRGDQIMSSADYASAIHRRRGPSHWPATLWLLALMWIFVGLFLLAGCSEVADAQASYDSHQDAIAMAQAAGIPPANK